MHTLSDDSPFHAVMSFEPLIDYWRNNLAQSDAHWGRQYVELEKQLSMAPELMEPIEDFSILDSRRDLVKALMAPIFPAAFWESELVGALVPFTLRPFFVSEPFRRYLLDEAGLFQGRLQVSSNKFVRAKLIRFYLLILRECYGIDNDFDFPLVRIVKDAETGLDRYFSFRPDLRFVQVRPVGDLEPLSENARREIMEHLTEPEILARFLPPEKFLIQGFTAMHAVDVTQSEVITALQNDLIDKGSIFSKDGFVRLQERLRTLFRMPELVVGLAAIQGDQALLINTGCALTCDCIYSSSHHIPLSDFEGSVFEVAARERRVVRVRDLLEESQRTPMEEQVLGRGVRSLIAAPLLFQDNLIGAINVGSAAPDRLGPMEVILMEYILPLFSLALKRGLDDFDNQVDGIIKEKCTAVHPSVEWRFRTAVLRHLEHAQKGRSSELEPIVFKDVFPLYGAADIRASSEARNQAIQADLAEHLTLAGRVVQTAAEARNLPILHELGLRIQDSLERIEGGLHTGDEVSTLTFLRNEVEPVFPFLTSFNDLTKDAVRTFEEAIDPNLRTVYRSRRDFEESVSVLNQRMTSYLDREESEAQNVFPHYFDKHQTDGVSYVIYIGPSMSQNGDFHHLYVRNLRLWQIMVSCGIAWHAQQLKSSLKVPLSVTHLVLMSHSPLAIRFRFDEKRFDVDGAYNIGHEIVRSRIDKAMVRGGTDRLTQPEKISLVYSRPEELAEIQRHVGFLQAQGYLAGDSELLELEDMPDVYGLKALRVRVNLESQALEERVRRIGW